jgi:hypothetical protein
MGVKINISGSEISGNSRVLNGIKVNSKSDIEVNVKKSEIVENAKVMNDISAENGTVRVNIEDMKLGKDAEFMNNRNVEFESRKEQSRESQVSREDGENSSINKSEVYMTTSMVKKKKSLFERIKDIFKFIKRENEIDDELVTVIREDGHKKFEDKISQNGKLKGVDYNVAKEIASREEQQVNKEIENEEKYR